MRALSRFAPLRFAPVRFAPPRSAPILTQPLQLTPGPGGAAQFGRSTGAAGCACGAAVDADAVGVGVVGAASVLEAAGANAAGAAAGVDVLAGSTVAAGTSSMAASFTCRATAAEADGEGVAVEADGVGVDADAGDMLPAPDGALLARGLHSRIEEQGGLEPLVNDREECDDCERPAAAGKGAIDLAMKVGLDRPGIAGHPEDHPGNEPHRCQARDAGKGLGDRVRERCGRKGEECTGSQREHDGEHDPGPQSGQQLTLIEFHDVCNEDRDNEGGFKSFSEADKKIREHVTPSGLDPFPRLQGRLALPVFLGNSKGCDLFNHSLAAACVVPDASLRTPVA